MKSYSAFSGAITQYTTTSSHDVAIFIGFSTRMKYFCINKMYDAENPRDAFRTVHDDVMDDQQEQKDDQTL